MGQRGHAHGHPLALLRLGRAGGGEADADHLVDRSEKAKLGKTLEVSAGREEGTSGRPPPAVISTSERVQKAPKTVWLSLN